MRSPLTLTMLLIRVRHSLDHSTAGAIQKADDILVLCEQRFNLNTHGGVGSAVFVQNAAALFVHTFRAA